MKRTTWLLPVLSAAYWGSCQTSHNGTEWAGSDARAAVCGFCASLALILIIQQLNAWDVKP